MSDPRCLLANLPCSPEGATAVLSAGHIRLSLTLTGRSLVHHFALQEQEVQLLLVILPNMHSSCRQCLMQQMICHIMHVAQLWTKLLCCEVDWLDRILVCTIHLFTWLLNLEPEPRVLL